MSLAGRAMQCQSLDARGRKKDVSRTTHDSIVLVNGYRFVSVVGMAGEEGRRRRSKSRMVKTGVWPFDQAWGVGVDSKVRLSGSRGGGGGRWRKSCCCCCFW